MRPDDTSIDTGNVPEFGAVDYIVFIFFVVCNAVIGIFYAVKDRRNKKDNPTEYLLGGRNQHVIPVALSLTVTFLSSVTLLGTPVEMYLYNTMFIYLALGMLLATLLSASIFIPFFYRLGITSIFEYLELRFHPIVRLLGSFLLIIQMFLYMAFVLYGPSLALSAVTGFQFESCLAGIGVVAAFYTVLGGMKAVLWTDTFQVVIIFAGLITVLVRGIDVVGGFPEAWEAADERGRVVMDDFEFNPTKRHSFFSVVIGGGLFWLSLYGANQAQVQRCLSTSNVTQARIAVLISSPFLILLSLLCCLIGIVMFAFYKDCDPVIFGVVNKYDQMLPLFAMDILGHLDGVPGLFVACIFSGSLSTLSSGLNAQSAIIYKEVQKFLHPKFSEMQATVFNKIIVAIDSGIIIGLAFLVSELGTLQENAMRVYGILNGPIFGLFILGMFFPWANAPGAFCGCLASLALMGWIGIGGYVHEVKNFAPSESVVSACNWTAVGDGSPPASTVIKRVPEVIDGVDRVYTLSYINYTMVGMATVIVVGLIVSFLTGYTRSSSLKAKYVMPIFSMIPPDAKEEMNDDDDFSKPDVESTGINGKTSETQEQRF